MKKIILRSFFMLFSIGIILLLMSCAGSSVNSNENITIRFTSPGLSSNDDEYIDLTGTLSIENGSMGSYSLIGKGTDVDDGEIEHYGVRYKIKNVNSKGIYSGLNIEDEKEYKGITNVFEGLNEWIIEWQEFTLNSIDDAVPAFNPDDSNSKFYVKYKLAFSWNGDKLTTITAYDWDSESSTFETDPGSEKKFEYNDDGVLRDMRSSGEYNNGDWFYDEAYWYSSYDETFTNFPILIYEFGATGEQDSIPDNYDYENNGSEYNKEKDTQYTYTSDSDGRIGTIIEEDWNGETRDYDSKIDITYDSSGNVSSFKIYEYDSEAENWQNSPSVQLDITVPSGLSFTLGNLFFYPGNMLITALYGDE